MDTHWKCLSKANEYPHISFHGILCGYPSISGPMKSQFYSFIFQHSLCFLSNSFKCLAVLIFSVSLWLRVYIGNNAFLYFSSHYLAFTESCQNLNYLIRSNYHTYPCKRTVKKLRTLQITASVLFLYFFIKAFVVGTHLNCINLLMQFK